MAWGVGVEDMGLGGCPASTILSGQGKNIRPPPAAGQARRPTPPGHERDCEFRGMAWGVGVEDMGLGGCPASTILSGQGKNIRPPPAAGQARRPTPPGHERDCEFRGMAWGVGVEDMGLGGCPASTILSGQGKNIRPPPAAGQARRPTPPGHERDCEFRGMAWGVGVEDMGLGG